MNRSALKGHDFSRAGELAKSITASQLAEKVAAVALCNKGTTLQAAKKYCNDVL